MTYFQAFIMTMVMILAGYRLELINQKLERVAIALEQTK